MGMPCRLHAPSQKARMGPNIHPWGKRRHALSQEAGAGEAGPGLSLRTFRGRPAALPSDRTLTR